MTAPVGLNADIKMLREALDLPEAADLGQADRQKRLTALRGLKADIPVLAIEAVASLRVAIWKYFAAEIISSLILAVVQAAIILAVGVFVFGAHLPGNWLWLLAPVILGSIVFLNIGFILSAWANTPSAASGMGNAISLPMMFFAGTFFSTASLPWLLPYLAEALPLTPMLSAMRAVSIDSESLWQIWRQLAVLTGWVVVTGLAAIKFFRFS